MPMKIGAEDKKKVAILAVLGVIVLGLAIYNASHFLIGGSAPPPVAVQTPSVAPASPAGPGTPSTGRQRAIPSRSHEATRIAGPMAGLDPTLHPEVMAQAESIDYTGKGRNIFSMFSEPVIEQAKAPIRPQPIEPQGPTGPPPPPPIDLKFFGYETHQGGARKAFLLHGDDVFIAGEGDVVDHHYKVVKIAPMSVQIEDIPYSNTQTLPLIQN